MTDTVLDQVQYREDTAGSIMSTEYVELLSNMTVADAFSYIQEVGHHIPNIYTCYVVDTDQKLIGMVSAKTLLLSNQEDLVGEVMEPNVIRANINDDQEAIVADIRKYGYMAIPVVDDDERMVGIFTYDEAFLVSDEEATEDFEKMAAMSHSEMPYLSSGVFALARQRIPWLFMLMIFASFTSLLVELFEDSLSVLPALVAFVPMLMNTGGNAGTQSSTMLIRGMALGDIDLPDIMKVLLKELLVSLFCGAVLVVVTYASVLVFGESNMMAITVCLAMLATIIVSNLIGVLLTFIAKAVHIDPAVMAAPLLTNVIDAMAIFMYFRLAQIIMGI